MGFLLAGGGKATFERLLDAATSQMLLEPNWVTNLEICDSIRQQDVTPKFALLSIRKRIADPNPHVSRFALIVLETCVKNCGQPFHEEIANADFLDEMWKLVETGSAPVKEQVLTMIQAWNHAFRNKAQFQPIQATYNLLRMQGRQFPPLKESDAMFSADAAPNWKDGDVCHLCRVKFGLVTRQHHCRACGEPFCSKCSTKQSIIPKLGIEREVRVCDTCYDEINPNAGKSAESASKTDTSSDLPQEYLNSNLAKESQTKPALSEEEVKAQEEEELQLAMAISLSEESVKAPHKNWSLELNKSNVAEPTEAAPKSTTFSDVAASLQRVGEDNSAELNKYFDRSFWEKKSAESKMREPSAPMALDTKVTPLTHPEEFCPPPPPSQETVEDFNGSDVFIKTMSSSIDLFLDRMNGVHSKGKHIAMDSTVQTLFQSLSAMHPQLMKLIEDEEESKVKYEAMLQKLSVIREARESLNDMRAQYQEKTRQQELEQEMLRRMQMEQKLELMRQQKQEYLEYQRQLQIQRQQELENYQQEKFRQRQTHGMGPDFQGFPEVPTHVPGTHLGSYPQLAGRYAEMVPQASPLPFKEKLSSIPQPQVENVNGGYEEMERPPQYPGNSRQYIPVDNGDPQMESVVPPSYGSITSGGGMAVPGTEFYNQHADHPPTNNWQPGTSHGNSDHPPMMSQQQPVYQEHTSLQHSNVMQMKQTQQFPNNGQFQQQSVPGGHAPVSQQINQELDRTQEHILEQQYQPQQLNQQMQQLPPTQLQQQPLLSHQQLPISQDHQQQLPLGSQVPQTSQQQQQQIPPAYQQPIPMQQQQQLPSSSIQVQQQQPLSQQQLPMQTKLQQQQQQTQAHQHHQQQHHPQGQQLQQQSQSQQYQQQLQGQLPQQQLPGQPPQQQLQGIPPQQQLQGQQPQQQLQGGQPQQQLPPQQRQQHSQGQEQSQMVQSNQQQYPVQPSASQPQYISNDMSNQLPQQQQSIPQHSDPQFVANQQQQQLYQQQYAANQGVEQVSQTMKDLQLISFD